LKGYLFICKENKDKNKKRQPQLVYEYDEDLWLCIAFD